MTANLPSWERPHFVPGGGTPYLFYAVFGNIDTSARLSADSYRCEGIPNGLELMSYGPNNHPDVVSSFRDGYVWNEFVATQPQLSSVVSKCTAGVLLRGTPTDDRNLHYFRDTIGLLTFLLDRGGCAIYDPFIFHWWAPEDWRRRVFEPMMPDPRPHVVILLSEDESPDRKWFHTRGMRKFGRPDISVHGVPPNLENGVIDLCNRLIEHQAFGLVVPEGQEVRMASLPQGTVITHVGDLDDPDFNNVHLEVCLPET